MRKLKVTEMSGSPLLRQVSTIRRIEPSAKKIFYGTSNLKLIKISKRKFVKITAARNEKNKTVVFLTLIQN